MMANIVGPDSPSARMPNETFFVCFLSLSMGRSVTRCGNAIQIYAKVYWSRQTEAHRHRMCKYENVKLTDVSHRYNFVSCVCVFVCWFLYIYFVWIVCCDIYSQTFSP